MKISKTFAKSRRTRVVHHDHELFENFAVMAYLMLYSIRNSQKKLWLYGDPVEPQIFCLFPILYSIE